MYNILCLELYWTVDMGGGREGVGDPMFVLSSFPFSVFFFFCLFVFCLVEPED